MCSIIGVSLLIALTHVTHASSLFSTSSGARFGGGGFKGVNTRVALASSPSSLVGISLPIPITLTTPYIALLFIVTLATNVIAALIPAIRTTKIPPAQTLRYE
ncbi:hypothetical protein [Caldivirga sp.]|uniref:hypothetical protein n=1 Tax=Caldivirga sp. TaxID=2080243 RepID=UPI003D1140EC